MIQAPGFSGTPFSGQEASAEANASCIASSARSKEPEIRIRAARMRPDSLRNTASAAERASAISRGRRARGGLPLGRGRHTEHRANLDRSFHALTACRNPRGPIDGFVEILAVGYVETGKLLLGFGEGAIREESFAILDAHRGRGRTGREWLGRHEDSFARSLFHQRP